MRLPEFILHSRSVQDLERERVIMFTAADNLEEDVNHVTVAAL